MIMNPSDASQDDAIPPPFNPSYRELALKQPMSITEEECSGGEPGPGSKGEGGELSNSLVYGLSHSTLSVYVCSRALSETIHKPGRPSGDDGKTPPKSVATTTVVTQDSGSVDYDDWDGLWILVRVAASQLDSETSPWYQEKSEQGIHVVRKCDDDAYEVVIDPAYLLGLKYRQLQMDLDYDPTQPGEIQKAIYGTDNATRKAHHCWVICAADVIRSGSCPQVEPIYRNIARKRRLHEELQRAILIVDIKKSAAAVRKALAQNLVFLFLNLEKDHDSTNAHIYLESSPDDLLENLEHSLSTFLPAQRTRGDEAQITSLTRALLEFSGGRVDCQQHGFAEEYTINENTDLYASLLEIMPTNRFGDFDLEKMRNALLNSPVFAGMTICASDLKQWTAKMITRLPIGFREGHLSLPSQILSGFGSGQVDMFEAYLSHTYQTFRSLQKPENNVLLLLTWSMVVSGSQLEVLSEWASSDNSSQLYQQLLSAFQGPQNSEQLALTMAALMGHRRLLYDVSTNNGQPIKGSYLADLDALLHGDSLGISGIVWERMVFSLLRVLGSFMDQFEDLQQFLGTGLDREIPLLHPYDGFSDQYLVRRIQGQSHDAAMPKMPELRADEDLDWVVISLSEARLTEQSQHRSPLEIGITFSIAQSSEIVNGKTMEPESGVRKSLMSQGDENNRVPDLYDVKQSGLL